MLVVLKQLKAQKKSLAPKTQTLENSCSDTIVGGGFIVKVVSLPSTFSRMEGMGPTLACGCHLQGKKAMIIFLCSLVLLLQFGTLCQTLLSSKNSKDCVAMNELKEMLL